MTDAGRGGGAGAQSGESSRAVDRGREGDLERLLTALPALLRELAESGVVELEVAVGEASLYLRQRPRPVPLPTEAGPLPPAAPEADVPEGLVAVTTPLAGVAYGAPSPDEPPYVQVGEAVQPGQVVALVEAMKVFNEIHVDVAGVVEEILVTGGKTVQAGQTLLLVRPDGEPLP